MEVRNVPLWGLGSRLSGGAAGVGAWMPNPAGPVARGAWFIRREALRSSALLPSAVALEVERGALFLCVPILLGIGAAAYFTFPSEPSWPVLLTGLAVCALCAVVLARRTATLAACAGLLLVAGAVAGKLETERMSTRMLGSAVTTRLTGRVVALDRTGAGRARLLLDVIRTERPALRYSPDRVRVAAGKLPPGLAPGATVTGLARLMPPPGPSMPGSYDFAFASYFDGIGGAGFFLGAPAAADPQPAEAGDAFQDWIERSRERLARHISAEVGGPEGEIAAALIVGVRGGIPEPVNEALRKTGLAHILSISGLHMALVAATVMGAVRGCIAAFPAFASRRPAKKYGAAAALVAVSGYALFSGADVAAVRSFVMLAIMLTAVLFDRAALTMRNLAIAASLILLWSPHEILGPSFQMSFAATAALIAAYAAWSDRRPERRDRHRFSPPWLRLARRGAGLVVALAATSVIAGAATGVFAAYHFHRVAPLSLPANLLVTPIVSVLVMPFALAAMIAMPFGLDGPFLWVMGFGLKLMLAVAAWLAGLSPVDAVGRVPPAAMLAAAAAIALFSVASTWLRVFAFPFAFISLVIAADAELPDIFVAEDGRVVGVRTSAGTLAVSTERGGGFTLENWLRAAAASGVTRATSGTPLQAADGDAEKAFSCKDGLCTLELNDGRIIAHASDARTAARACGIAAVLIVRDPQGLQRCRSSRRPHTIITARDLALKGSAMLFRQGPNWTRKSTTTIYALHHPPRPWHQHRLFARTARGLPERVGERSDRRLQTSFGTTAAKSPPMDGASKQQSSLNPEPPRF